MKHVCSEVFLESFLLAVGLARRHHRVLWDFLGIMELSPPDLWWPRVRWNDLNTLLKSYRLEKWGQMGSAPDQGQSPDVLLWAFQNTASVPASPRQWELDVAMVKELPPLLAHGHCESVPNPSAGNNPAKMGVSIVRSMLKIASQISK